MERHTSTLDEVSMILLGNGGESYVNYRKKVRNDLSKIGYNKEKIIIMEKLKDEINDISLESKFQRILITSKPRIYIAFFHKNVKMDGLAFELGWLCCKEGSHQLAKKLLVLHETNYNWAKTTGYISSLFHIIARQKFDESKKYSKSSYSIHKFILNSLFNIQNNS